MVMDVVVADVPPKYGMLLSRSWGAKLQGTMQMDMTYASIPIFGQLRRLYREPLMKFMVSSPGKPKKSPLYSIHTNLDSFILFNDDITNEQELEDGILDNRVEITKPNTMETLEKEETKEEVLEQLPKLEN